MSGARVAVELDAVEVVEGGRRVLGPVCWQIGRAERWVVLGPNGAGKSTLLRLVGGWRLPTRGRVEVLGERFGEAHLPSLRRRIGWLSGELERRLPPAASVADVVLTARHGALRRFRQHDAPEDKARAEMLLDWLGCGALADRAFGTLSDGERQRVLLARALLPEPELLLLDEPFAGLDLAGREQLVAALADLAAGPASPPTVLVTHHVEDVPPGFTHGLLLRQGVTAAAGPLVDVLAEGPLTAAFGLALRIERRDGRYTSVSPPAGRPR